MSFFRRAGLVVLFSILTILPVQAQVSLGVIAPRGELKAMKQWSALGDYLTQELGETVKVYPVAPGGALTGFEGGRFDVLLTNPVQAAIARERHGAQLLASLVKNSGKQFAGVIVARADSDIRTAADLRGKRVMTLAPTAAGGFMFQAVHAMDAGLKVPSDFAVHKIGKNQDDLVKLVVRGVFDAAFVRSGILEALAKEGAIDMADIVVVDERRGDGFGLIHTTRLYPEWFALSQASFDRSKSELIGKALIALPADHPAAASANIKGFVAPQDIAPIVDALRQLQVEPFVF